jgi:hypothetical protein
MFFLHVRNGRDADRNAVLVIVESVHQRMPVACVDKRHVVMNDFVSATRRLDSSRRADTAYIADTDLACR